MEKEFSGRSVAEAAIKACETLGTTRSELKYRIVSEDGELLNRRVVIAAEVASSTASEVLSLQTPDIAIEVTGKTAPLQVNAPTDQPLLTNAKPDTARRDYRESHQSRGGRRQAQPKTADNEGKSHYGIDGLLQEVMPEVIKNETESKPEIVLTHAAGQKALSAAQKILELTQLQVEVRCVGEDENELHFCIVGEDAPKLLGKKGEVLAALQFILNRIITAGEEFTEQMVVIDINRYRERRLQALTKLAERLAEKSLHYQKAVRLTPMSAYDRRVFHLALQKVTGIVTRSEGLGDMRHLLIIPAELL